MGLKFVLGNAGSGKTSYCTDEIIKKDNYKNSLIYIVPEQFSMESEKLLLKKKKEKVLINTVVYSFRHLAFNIMSELGVGDKRVLNDVGRAMLIKKTLLGIQKELDLYKTSVNHKGFTDSLSSTIAELMQYNVTSEMLVNVIDSLSECNLKYKLKDIEKIYTSYCAILKSSYISSENTLDILADILKNSKAIKESEIWIDGFKSFTPQEYAIISELLKCSKNVTIALTVDKPATDTDLSDAYYETKTTVVKLSKLARDNGIAVFKPVILNEIHRFNNSELRFLADNYLNIKPQKYKGKCEHIAIYNSPNKYSEIDMVCSKINSLVKTGNYKYEDIAVIIGSEEYEKPLCNSLNHYNIPNFIDTRRDITSHPLTQTILSAIKIISDNMSMESVFRLLKCGYLTDIEQDDVFLLENYVISQNIKGKKWFEEWEYGFDDKVFEKSLIEDIRDTFLDCVSTLTDNIKKSRKYTVRKISSTVFEFLKDINACATLNENIKKALDNNDIAASMSYKQIWGLLCDVFEKMTEFLGDEKVNINEYVKILESGLESASIGVIPAMSDQLIVGDIERTRLPDIKALFIIGVNEGILPPQRTEAGIFSDMERIAIKNNFFDLAPELSVKLSQDKLNIYLALTKPSEHLYLSYSTGSIKGGELAKSPVISKIEEIFEDIKEINYRYDTSFSGSPLPALDKLILSLKNDDEITDYQKAEYVYFLNSEKYQNRIKNINNILNIADNDYLSLDICQKLYGNGINISVSRLEAFSKCPYSFFLTYCLNASEREKYKFENLESGNIYHAALEQAFNTIRAENIDIAELEDDEIVALSDKSIDAAIVQTKKQSLIGVPRYKGYINRMKKTLSSVLWGFGKNAAKDKFKPKEFELSFGSKSGIEPITYMLENGVSINLTGKIDRIDHLRDKDKVYVKIIDYKQSEHKTDFNEIYHGIDIQLPLYMHTYVGIMQKYHNMNAEPGSILYYNIHYPKLDKPNADIQNALLKAMRFRGIVSNDKTVSSSIKYQVISPIMLSGDEFAKLGDFIDKKIIETGTELSNGNIKIKPYRYINKSSVQTGCDYCQYKAICRIDLKNPANKYNSFKADKNILDKITDSEE